MRTATRLTVFAGLLFWLCVARPAGARARAALPLAPGNPLWAFWGDTLLGELEAFYDTVHQTQDIAARVAHKTADRGRDVARQSPLRPYWFVPVRSVVDVRALSARYGVPLSYLQTLNPGVDLQHISKRTRILIYRRNPAVPARSIGAANHGSMDGGMPMIDGPYWVVRNPAQSWALPETVHRIVAGLMWVGNHFAGGGKVLIGDLSRPRGGRLRPHHSHQSGRDADITYYRLGGGDEQVRFWNAESNDLDVARTWALFRYWIQWDVVQYIFAARSIQHMLADYAYSIGENPEFVRHVFAVEGGRRRSIVRYAPGHDTHFHVRFKCIRGDPDCR